MQLLNEYTIQFRMNYIRLNHPRKMDASAQITKLEIETKKKPDFRQALVKNYCNTILVNKN